MTWHVAACFGPWFVRHFSKALSEQLQLHWGVQLGEAMRLKLNFALFWMEVCGWEKGAKSWKILKNVSSAIDTFTQFLIWGSYCTPLMLCACVGVCVCVCVYACYHHELDHFFPGPCHREIPGFYSSRHMTPVLSVGAGARDVPDYQAKASNPAQPHELWILWDLYILLEVWISITVWNLKHYFETNGPTNAILITLEALLEHTELRPDTVIA